MSKTALYTVGHSTHTLEYFVDLLKQHDITALCDVRSQPYSAYNSQYNREDLHAEMKRCGIQYVFLGKELGARSDSEDCYVNDQVQFSKLADDETFQRGLTRLREGAEKYRIALMCAEKDPLICHRMILVTRQLRDEFEVKHICANGKIESNDDAEQRLVNPKRESQNDDQATISMSTDGNNTAKLVADAYDKRGAKIAYKRNRETK